MRTLRFGAIVLAALVCAATDAAAQAGSAPPDRTPRLDAELRAAARDTAHRAVIVTVRPGTRSRVARLLARQGHGVAFAGRDLDIIPMQLRGTEASALAGNPDVLAISSDAPVTVGHSIASGVTAAITSSADQFDAQALRSTLGITSTEHADSVGIAIVDSGIAPMPDLAGRIAAFYDFTRGGIRTPPSDEFGHGTHIAGLIAGNGALSGGRYVGVTTARLIGLKVLDGTGSGRTSDVIAAIEFAVANRTRLGIDIVNLSLGHPILESAATDPLVRAVERAVAAGLVVVASAGNHGSSRDGRTGYAGITSPGNAPSAITVGAFASQGTADRSDDVVARFSSRGPTWRDGYLKPDVLAPGEGMVAVSAPSTSLYRDGRFAADVPSYIRLSGASMATAVTTGVVALAIEAHRRDERSSAPLTPNTVKAVLQYTSLALPDDDPSTAAAFEQGAGGINAAGAMALARAIDPGARPGDWWLEDAVIPASAIGGQHIVWSQHIVWGTHIVWGASVMWSQKAWFDHTAWGRRTGWQGGAYAGSNLVDESLPVWSSAIVWGPNLISTHGNHIVWGTLLDEHIVWGSSARSDDHIVRSTAEEDDHIVWGASGEDEHIVAGAFGEEAHIVPGTSEAEEHIVWGTRVGDAADASSGGD